MKNEEAVFKIYRMLRSGDWSWDHEFHIREDGSRVVNLRNADGDIHVYDCETGEIAEEI